jgi:MFS transporter, FSR family, fosmidomycin resistance protein
MATQDAATVGARAAEHPDGAGATTVEAPSLSTGRGRGILAGFTAAHFSHHVSNSLLNPLLPLIRDSFALSYAQSGTLVSAFSLSLGLSNPLMGVLADRFGSRVVVVGGLVLTGGVSLAIGLAGSYWQLAALLVLLGVVGATYHAPSAALIAQIFPPNVRGAAMGFHITGGHLSFFAVPLLAAALVGAGETWRAPYIWFAFAPVLFGAMLWWLAPDRRERSSGGASRLAVFGELASVIRTIGPLVTVSVLFQMGYAALLAFFALYLVDARGLPGAFAAAIFGVPHLVGIVAAPLSGHLSDRLGRRNVILLGMGGLGPALYGLTLVPNDLILLPLALVGLATSMRQTVTEVLVMDSAPAHRRATVLGGYYLLSQELGGLAAPLLGVLAGLFGIGAAFTGTTMLMAAMSAVVLVIGRKL